MKKILFKILSWIVTVLTIGFFVFIAYLIVGFALGTFPVIIVIGGLLVLTLEIADLFIRLFIWTVDKLIKRRLRRAEQKTDDIQEEIK